MTESRFQALSNLPPLLRVHGVNSSLRTVDVDRTIMIESKFQALSNLPPKVHGPRY